MPLNVLKEMILVIRNVGQTTMTTFVTRIYTKSPLKDEKISFSANVIYYFKDSFQSYSTKSKFQNYSTSTAVSIFP